MPRLYTFDELDHFARAWHPKGFLWSASPGCTNPVYAWPQHDDELGGEPDLERDDVMIRRVDSFPYGGWLHFADCDCEDCTGIAHCPGCGEAFIPEDRWPLAVDETGKTWERIPWSDGDPGYAFHEKCPRCGADKGEVHVDGCEVERCPKCGGVMRHCLSGDGPCTWENLRYRYVNEKPGGEVPR
jgi:rRNA maturation protein Nop10